MKSNDEKLAVSNKIIDVFKDGGFTNPEDIRDVLENLLLAFGTRP